MRVGTDLIEISRVKKSLEIKGFRERVYSREEIDLLEGRGAQSYAANFAAKEAFSKALGTGVRGFSLNEVSVLRDNSGAPYLMLSGRAKEAAKGFSFTVSLTHTREYAMAVVVAEEIKNEENICK